MTPATFHGFMCRTCKRGTRWECIDLATQEIICTECGRDPFAEPTWLSFAVEVVGLVALAGVVWAALAFLGQ